MKHETTARDLRHLLHTMRITQADLARIIERLSGHRPTPATVSHWFNESRSVQAVPTALVRALAMLPREQVKTLGRPE